MDNAGLRHRDARGLMPLARARALLAQHDTFAPRGLGDVLWAALLSLEDAAELVQVAGALTWRNHPRGVDNIDLYARYRNGILPWLAQLVDDDGLLLANPWCTQACLLACTSKRAFDLAYRVRFYSRRDQPTELASQWVERHRRIGMRELARRADGGDKRATVLLRRCGGAAKAQGLAGAILQHLDDHAEVGFGHIDYAHAVPCAVARWPLLSSPHPELAFGGLRLVAARARRGRGWGIVLERLTGIGSPSPQVTQYAYGSQVSGGYVLCARPSQRGFGDALEHAVPLLGLTDPQVIVRTADFEHVVGSHVFVSDGRASRWHIPPSESPTYRSLARAIASRDGSLFEAGTINTRRSARARRSTRSGRT
jgi:hypothetical protein